MTFFASLALTNGQCNWGSWIFYPLAEGQCSTPQQGRYEYSSFMFDCESSTSGKIYYYTTNNCSSDSLYNTSTPEDFDCSMDTCDYGIKMTFNIHRSSYGSNSNCSGHIYKSSSLYMVEDTLCINRTVGIAIEADVTIDGMYLSYCGDNGVCNDKNCSSGLNFDNTYCEYYNATTSLSTSPSAWGDYVAPIVTTTQGGGGGDFTTSGSMETTNSQSDSDGESDGAVASKLGWPLAMIVTTNIALSVTYAWTIC